jgi:hypothetical protein
MKTLIALSGDRRVCAGVFDEHQLVARNENRRLELSAIKYISTTQAVQVHVLRAAAAVVIYVDIG